MNIKNIIEELDKMNAAGNELQGISFLENKLSEAENNSDDHAALSMISELLGQYRRCGVKETGLEMCKKAIDKVNKLNMGRSVSGATVLINAATTMKAFGEAEAAIPIFEACEKIYLERLAVNDYRISALYNNMALAYEDVNDYIKAEEGFKKALAFLEDKEDTECDRAVTYCSLAELSLLSGKSEEESNQYIESAWELFNKAKKDGYLSFSIGKCLQAFDYFGFFIYSKMLKEIKDEIDEIYR